MLPRAVGHREPFTDPHALHSVPTRLTVDAVPITEERGRRGVVREGVDHLLGGSGAVECSVTLKWNAAALVAEHDEDEEDAPGGRMGTVKTSMETRSRTWLVRNVRQV